MIEPINKKMKEYLPWMKKYGVTKFIDKKTGEGHRGVIVHNNGTDAILFGLTGIYYGKLLNVFEIEKNSWPEVFV